MRAFLVSQPKPRLGSCVASRYSLPLTSLTDHELEDEKARLTMQARCTFGSPPPPFCAWSVSDGALFVPRFYGLTRFGPPERDDRTDGEYAAIDFVGTPTPVQARATEAVFARDLAPGGLGGTMVVLPCGYGKTCWAIQTMARLKRKTCVIVHKGVLRDQWVAAIERFCAPGVRVGFLQGDTNDLEACDVLVAMVLTLAKRDLPPLDAVGLVVCDEAHHMAAPVMNLAMRHFRARHVIGLTATLERPDGLTPLLHHTLGPEGFRTERDAQESVRVSVALFPGAARDVLTRDGKPIASLMINALAKHAARNAFLVERVVAYRAAGRVVMVLSDRLAQLALLRTALEARLPPGEVGLFVGATKEAQRAVELAKPVVLCSYAMANEGVDKVELDTCVFATPKGRVTQAIGRCQRPCATKRPPLVLDVVDDNAVFQTLRFGRQRHYAKERYSVQTLSAGDHGSSWWG